MKKSLKLLSLITIMSMIVCCFAACNNKDEKKADSSEDEVKKVVEEYIDASFEEYDSFDDFENGISDYLDPDGDEYEDKIDGGKETLEAFSEFAGDDALGEEIMMTMHNVLSQYKDVEINEISVDGETSEVEVTFTTVNENDVDIDSILNSSSNLSDLEEKFEEACEEADTEEKDQTVYLEKIDGNWLITKIK